MECVYIPYKTYTSIMEWLDSLGKYHQMVYLSRKKTFNVKEYKAAYYIKNIEKYTERNRIASKKRTEERIDKLSDDDTIHKLKYLLEN